MAKVYFHIDMNAFFVNAEILMDPTLKDKPVAVSNTTSRSVITTASYEARKFGVNSAMPLQQALHMCPKLIVVQPHFHLYRTLSEQFINIVRSYSDEIEQASIDECYVDVSEVIMTYEKPLQLAYEIQRRIYTEVGLPCSIGVGPNMFLAKMASDMKKPMGITVLRIRDVKEKMWPLSIGDMRGVGKKTEPLLRELGIRTIGDLAMYPHIEDLKNIFGKNTEMIMQRTKGFDEREIVKEWDPKSMGVSETFPQDIQDEDELYGILRSLSRQLAKRLKKEKKVSKNITIRIRGFDFKTTDRSLSLPNYIFSSNDIYNQAYTLFSEYWQKQPLRLLGISLSKLKDIDSVVEQLNIFDYAQANKEETRDVIRDLNAILNGKVFKRASEVKTKHEA